MPCSGAPSACFAGSTGPALASFPELSMLVSEHVVTDMDVSFDFSSPDVTEAIAFFHVGTSRRVASRSSFSVSEIVIQKGHHGHFLQRDWLSWWQGPGSLRGVLLASAIAAQERGHGDVAVSAAGG